MKSDNNEFHRIPTKSKEVQGRPRKSMEAFEHFLFSCFFFGGVFDLNLGGLIF